MSVTVLYDVAWPGTLRHVPRPDLPAVLAIRDRIVADAPNLPALTDAVVEDALPALYHARYVLHTPWVVEYSWSVVTQVLVLRAVRAPDPPF
ncbi:MAG: hypothetical protein U0324_37015 [Polyangiales bacterium]